MRYTHRFSFQATQMQDGNRNELLVHPYCLDKTPVRMLRKSLQPPKVLKSHMHRPSPGFGTKPKTQNATSHLPRPCAELAHTWCVLEMRVESMYTYVNIYIYTCVHILCITQKYMYLCTCVYIYVCIIYIYIHIFYTGVWGPGDGPL